MIRAEVLADLGLNEKPDLADVTNPWGIFYTPAGNFLGRLVHTNEAGVMTLAPAYSYVAQTSIDARSNAIARPKYIVPIELLISACVVEIPPCPVVWIFTFDDEDREDLLKGIATAEIMRDAQRKKRSPIAVVPAGTKLPPLRGV